MAKNQWLIDEAALPSPAARFEMAQAAAEFLARRGYDAVGIDHFALPGDSLARAARDGRMRRNFQGYTADAADVLIGFGASSISSYPAGYAQNVFETGAYMRAVEEGRLPIAKGIRLKREDIWRREAIERLMCDFKLDFGQLARRHALAERDFSADLARLQPLIADGLVEVSGNCVIITPRGRPLARAVAAAFDAYLAKADRMRAPLHAKV
jgi:oxygen-independent coproporphyrinogen-3 oxidase